MLAGRGLRRRARRASGAAARREQRQPVVVGPASLRHRELRQRDEALEPQRPVQHLRREADRRRAAATELALGDVERGRERADVGRPPGHEPAHRLGDDRVGFAGVRQPRQEPIPQQPQRLGRGGGRRHALAEHRARATEDLVQRHRAVDELGRRHAERRRRRPGTEADADHGRPGRQHLDVRAGPRADDPRDRADAAGELHAAVRNRPVRVGSGVGPDPLDPQARQMRRQPGRRRQLAVGLVVHAVHYDTPSRELIAEL
jgi:hypothetical protein